MTARHIYVDETKQRDYLLVASVHIATDLSALRRLIRELLMPNQRCLHMKDENPGRRRRSPQRSSPPAYRPPSIEPPAHNTAPKRTADTPA